VSSCPPEVWKSRPHSGMMMGLPVSLENRASQSSPPGTAAGPRGLRGVSGPSKRIFTAACWMGKCGTSSARGGGTSANLGNSCNRGDNFWLGKHQRRERYRCRVRRVWLARLQALIPAVSGVPGLQRAEISSSARWLRIATGAPGSPQLATSEYVEKRHQRDETEHGPCQLRAAADIPAGGKVNPHQDHGNGMEEADQEFEDLLHCLNLPGPLRVPVRSCPAQVLAR
jgi:hypothetical protein